MTRSHSTAINCRALVHDNHVITHRCVFPQARARAVARLEADRLLREREALLERLHAESGHLARGSSIGGAPHDSHGMLPRGQSARLVLMRREDGETERGRIRTHSGRPVRRTGWDAAVSRLRVASERVRPRTQHHRAIAVESPSRVERVGRGSGEPFAKSMPLASLRQDAEGRSALTGVETAAVAWGTPGRPGNGASVRR